MSTSLKQIAEWFEHGRQDSAMHMIIVCDTFNYDDYPVYVRSWQDFWTEYAKYDNKDMQKVMEVYSYAIPWSKQSSGYVMNTPPRVDQ